MNNRRRSFVLVLVTSAGLLLAACASVNVKAEQLTHQSIVASEQLHDAKVITDDQFKATNLELNKVAVAGREYTKLVIASQAKPADALVFLQAVTQAIANLKAAPFGGTIGHVLDYLTQLEGKLRGVAGQ